jgi:hypothetical protein
MSDQIAFQIPKTQVYEAESFDIEVYFRTRATKAALAPTTVHYRVDCLTSKKELITWTSVSAGENITINMTAAFNAIQVESNPWERKQLIVKADDGLSTQTIGQVRYKVKNLRGIG